MLGMTETMLDATLEEESRELRRRVARYRQDQPPISLRGRTAIIIDDGMATGMTDLAAVRAVRKRGAGRVLVAVPVASSEAVAVLEQEADRVICLTVPRRLYGVGMWYEDFAPVSDEEVLALLAATRNQSASGADPHPATGDGARTRPGIAPEPVEEELVFELDGTSLPASLIMPAHPQGLVVFAHGSGSSRHSPRNRAVAKDLANAGFASLLFDLLSAREGERRELAFDVALLSDRLQEVTRRARSEPRLATIPVGYFGASTGAAAALCAAAALGEGIAAVVSRGGRPDLAGDALRRVLSPTLLIVGEREVIEGAGHLFEEPGALERVCLLASDWFRRYLGEASRATR
jgi:putative phosphoribosyl transferase